jgi:hypothetical protein
MKGTGKRRKVCCVFRSKSDATCTGYHSRGTKCHSQKFVDEDVAASATRSIPDRVGRLEPLMETCLQTLMEVRQDRNDGSYDVLTPSSSITPNVHKTAPVLSLFNNDLVGTNLPFLELMIAVTKIFSLIKTILGRIYPTEV